MQDESTYDDERHESDGNAAHGGSIATADGSVAEAESSVAPADSGSSAPEADATPGLESLQTDSPASGDSLPADGVSDDAASQDVGPELDGDDQQGDSEATEVGVGDTPSEGDGGSSSGDDAEHDADLPVADPQQAPVPAERPVPAYDDSTPLARELSEITRRRRALAQADLPLPEQTRVFTIANQKGGVGKTTSTVNLAAALARHGARVLVIDLDPQGNASTALGVEHRSDVTSVYDVIVNDVDLAEVVQKSPEFEALYCVPATIHLAGAEIELVSLVAREQRLRSALDAFLASSPEPFHYVFIDCPPSLGLLTINAFVAAREVLIPIQCEYYALEGLSQLLGNIGLIERHLNPSLTVSTILLTMYDGRTNLANQVAQEVRDHFPDQVLDTVIPRNVRISEAPSYGQSVISYDTNSPGSLSYLEAAAEIARRGAPA